MLRQDQALRHLSEARRHFEDALNGGKAAEPFEAPKAPLRRGGEF
jgi:hypothetical protein